MIGSLHRAEDLGIIRSTNHVRIRGAFDERGWDGDEPGEDYPVEDQRMFEEFVYRASTQDVIGQANEAELLGLAADNSTRHGTCGTTERPESLDIDVLITDTHIRSDL
jgi:hypothetical protein